MKGIGQSADPFCFLGWRRCWTRSARQMGWYWFSQLLWWDDCLIPYTLRTSRVPKSYLQSRNAML